MKAKLYQQSGAVIGDVDLPDSVFAAEVNESLLHQVIIVSGEPAPRYGEDQKSRRGLRRRQEAVAAEGDRPCPRGVEYVAVVGARR